MNRGREADGGAGLVNPGREQPVCYNEVNMRAFATIGLAVGIALLWAPMSAPAAPKALVEVKASLRGEVLADGLAKAGDSVNEGDPLVYVRTQTGRDVAARATVDGRVAEMLVGPGAVIRDFGTVVARIEPK